MDSQNCIWLEKKQGNVLENQNVFLNSWHCGTAEVVQRIEANNDITSCAAQNKNQQYYSVWESQRQLKVEKRSSGCRYGSKKLKTHTMIIKTASFIRRLLLTVCVWPQTESVWGSQSVSGTRCALGTTTAALHTNERERHTHLHTNTVPQCSAPCNTLA